MSHRSDRLRLGRESDTGSAHAERVAHNPPHALSRRGKMLVTDDVAEGSTSQAGTLQILDPTQYQHHQHHHEKYEQHYQQEMYPPRY